MEVLADRFGPDLQSDQAIQQDDYAQRHKEEHNEAEFIDRKSLRYVFLQGSTER